MPLPGFPRPCRGGESDHQVPVYPTMGLESFQDTHPHNSPEAKHSNTHLGLLRASRHCEIRGVSITDEECVLKG